jgi:hypothetical protein
VERETVQDHAQGCGGATYVGEVCMEDPGFDLPHITIRVA